MASKRTKVVLVTVAITLFVGGVLTLMGYYEGRRRVERDREWRDKFSALEEKLPDMEKLRRIPMVYKERVQPLDTVARSTIRELSGKRKLYGQDCVRLFASLAFDPPEYWEDVPLILVQQPENKELFGLDRTHSLVSLKQIRESERFQAASADASRLSHEDPKAMTPAQLELGQIENRAIGLERQFDYLFNVVPPWPGQDADLGAKRAHDWHPPVATHGGAIGNHDRAKSAEFLSAWRAMKEAWRARDAAALDAALDRLHFATQEMGGSELPDPHDVEAEIAFNAANPMTTASYWYAAAAVLGLFAIVFGVSWLGWASLGLAIAGLGFQFYGFLLRWDLGFGVLITNLYESMISVAFLAALIGVVVDLFRRKFWCTALGALTAFIVLQVVDLWSVKFDNAIGGTVAVLANNIWVHIHVPTIMAAYAAYAIMWFLAAVAVVWILFFDRQARSPELREVLRTATIAMSLGVVLNFIGMVLGGVWAAESWGRFWGWDPKETWAFILFMYHTVIIHGRYTKWMNAFWSSAAMFLGGAVLLFAYYGTNELLPGFHSYANSADASMTFWDNLVHARNRWFVVSEAALILTTAAFILYYLATGGGRRGAALAKETPATPDAAIAKEGV